MITLDASLKLWLDYSLPKSRMIIICSKLGFSQILDHFMTRFGSVRTFGYNSAESEPIWLKSGAFLSTLSRAGPGRFWVPKICQGQHYQNDPSVFRLTFLSQPNKAGLIGLSVRTYVCTSLSLSTKCFFDFNDIWYVGRGRWVMHDSMQYDPIQGQGQGHEPWKVGNSFIF